MKHLNSNWCTFLVIFTQVTAFLPLGINLTLLNPSAPAIEVFVNETYKQRYNTSATAGDTRFVIAMAQSSLIVGTALGCLIFRPILHWLSRRSCIAVVHVLSIVSSVFMSPIAKLGQSYEAFIVGRVLNGLSRGISFTAVPLYVAEIVNRKTLATYQCFPGFLIQFGSAIGNGLGHPEVLGGVTTWPYLMAIPAIFSVMYLVAIPFLPRTLTYVMSKIDKLSTMPITKLSGYSLLKRLRCGNDEEVMQEYKLLSEELNDDAHIQAIDLKQAFTKRKYRLQLFGAIAVQLTAQAGGMQAVLLYTNTIFETAGIGPERATFYTIGLFLLTGIVGVVCAPFLHRYGSRRMLLNGSFIMLVALGLLTASTILTGPVMPYISLASLVFYFIGTTAGPFLSIISLVSEITTQRSRPIILWFSGILFWTFGSIVAFVTPYALESIGGYTYIIFVAILLAMVSYIQFFIPNTHNRTVIEIQRKIQGKKFRKTASVMQDNKDNRPSTVFSLS